MSKNMLNLATSNVGTRRAALRGSLGYRSIYFILYPAPEEGVFDFVVVCLDEETFLDKPLDAAIGCTGWHLPVL